VLLAPALSAGAVAAVVLVAVAAGNKNPDFSQQADKPVVETALPTPAPSEKGCSGWGRGAASPAPDLPARTASVTRLERDGSLTWTRALPVDDISAGQFPPLVLGDRTLVLAGGTLRSYATGTGRENWVVPAEGAPYGLWHARGTAVVLVDQVSQKARLLGFDPETGDVRWTYRIPGNGLMAEQVLAQDGTLVTVLSGGNQVQAIDTSTGKVRWTADRGGSPLITVAEDLVIQPVGAHLKAYRLQDGSPVWATPVPQDEIAVKTVAGVLLTVPTVQGPGYDTGVHAYDPATGAPLWSRPGGQQALRVAGELPGAVLVADDNFAGATLTAVEARTGTERWTVPARTVYEQPLVTGAGVIAVPERRGEAYVVARRDVQTGRLLDEASLPHELSLQPLTDGRYLFQTYGAPGEPGTVTVRSLATGAQEFQADVRHASRAPASLPDGAVILQGLDPGRACVG
jgi:outer membrane protein assembly factor BamB